MPGRDLSLSNGSQKHYRGNNPLSTRFLLSFFEIYAPRENAEVSGAYMRLTLRRILGEIILT
jgi:hypothetical protein